jgi:hypothetical protein
MQLKKQPCAYFCSSLYRQQQFRPNCQISNQICTLCQSGLGLKQMEHFDSIVSTA